MEEQVRSPYGAVDDVKAMYEEPQLVDLEEDVGCDHACVTGGDVTID